MSAKVIKCLEPVDLLRLPIPEIGDRGGASPTGTFVVPTFDPTTLIAEPPVEESLIPETPDEILERARRKASNW